ARAVFLPGLVAHAPDLRAFGHLARHAAAVRQAVLLRVIVRVADGLLRALDRGRGALGRMSERRAQHEGKNQVHAAMLTLAQEKVRGALPRNGLVALIAE